MSAEQLRHRVAEPGLRTAFRRRVAHLLEVPDQPPVRRRFVRLLVLLGTGAECVPRLTPQLLGQQPLVRRFRPVPVQLERNADLSDVVQPRPERHQRPRLVFRYPQRLRHHAPLVRGQQFVPDDLGDGRRVQQVADQRMRTVRTGGVLAQPGGFAPEAGVQKHGSPCHTFPTGLSRVRHGCLSEDLGGTVGSHRFITPQSAVKTSAGGMWPISGNQVPLPVQYLLLHASLGGARNPVGFSSCHHVEMNARPSRGMWRTLNSEWSPWRNNVSVPAEVRSATRGAS